MSGAVDPTLGASLGVFGGFLMEQCIDAQVAAVTAPLEYALAHP